MREITPENAADYLRDTGRVPPGRAARVEALGWGVSNVVMLVEVEGETPYVLKQARERLRTQALWVSRLERVWVERDVLDLLAGLVPEGEVPRVLFSDEPNYLFAMTAAPAGSAVWKGQLLAGQVDANVARRAGAFLGTVHRATAGHPALDGRFADTTIFDELRLDPFYRYVARARPDLAPALDGLIASTATPPVRCLVLGDFSPKNILVHPGGTGLTVVDFETAHAGDPAFDLGFFLSHLWLKSVRELEPGDAGSDDAQAFDARRRAYVGVLRLGEVFLDAYARAAGPAAAAGPNWPPSLAPVLDDEGDEPTPPATRTDLHLWACALARVDGKSPVDYLAPAAQDLVREVTAAGLLGA